MELNRKNMKMIRQIILFIAMLIVIIWKYEAALSILRFILSLLFPFLLGGAIAFILNVPMGFFQRHLFPEEKTKKSKVLKKLAKPLSIVIVLILMLLILGVVILVVIPQLAQTFTKLGSTISKWIPQVQEVITSRFGENKQIIDFIDQLDVDWGDITNKAAAYLNEGVNAIFDSTFKIVSGIMSGITSFFIALIFSIYILLQKEKLGLQGKKLLYAFIKKERADQVVGIFSLSYKTFSSFLTGQCLEAVILGTMFFITMTILRLPYALLVSLLIAIMALIPIFGAFIGLAIGSFLIVMVNPMQALIFIIMFFVLQQIEGNLIYPHVVGNSVGLPSIWVLMAVTLGGNLMGVLGMLLFIPLMSILYTILRGAVNERLRKKALTIKDFK
ncbi:MAG TPA: AI-2E family transporter [Candidatus Dorea intestinavium]|nr:AI-2E family transporter [Candidatus Dorea intestinavium]